MESLEFFQKLQRAIEASNGGLPTLSTPAETHTLFLYELTLLQTSVSHDDIYKMTVMSILFEGFYQHLSSGTLKQQFNKIRTERWAHHFGTPTITFLLSFKAHIELTKQFFQMPHALDNAAVKPWLIDNANSLQRDERNHTLFDPASIVRVPAPSAREITGFFTKTHNPLGGFTTTPCDLISQQFIEHAALSSQSGGKILEIGAGFGAATLEAIAKGATVFCNDIDAANLAVVQKRFMEISTEPADPATGDSKQLVLVPGELPDELMGLPAQSFDAILICRVLHFFTGEKIEVSLQLLSNLLVKGGKIYIVCETPFLKNWQRFTPEYSKREMSGIEWPGEITDPATYESSGRAVSLPKFVHWITKEVLDRSLVRSGFAIQDSTYINRTGQFPEDLLLDGKESVGAIGVKL